MATETKLRQLAQGGCPVYYFYSSERYLVRQAVARASKLLAEGEDEETTVLDGATPEIEQLIMAAGTISFFGTRRVVVLPEVDMPKCFPWKTSTCILQGIFMRSHLQTTY